jgi:hypothetical protein
MSTMPPCIIRNLRDAHTEPTQVTLDWFLYASCKQSVHHISIDFLTDHNNCHPPGSASPRQASVKGPLAKSDERQTHYILHSHKKLDKLILFD